MEIAFPHIPPAYAPVVFEALLVIFAAGAIIALIDRRKPKEHAEHHEHHEHHAHEEKKE